MTTRREWLKARWWLDALGGKELGATIVAMIPNEDLDHWTSRAFPGGPGVGFNPTPEAYEKWLVDHGYDPAERL